MPRVRPVRRSGVTGVTHAGRDSMGDRPLSLDELQLVARSQAAGLARLTGEIDRLRAERDEALREATMAEAKRSQAVYEHNQLKAEVDRLRELSYSTTRRPPMPDRLSDDQLACLRRHPQQASEPVVLALLDEVSQLRDEVASLRRWVNVPRMTRSEARRA